MTTSNSELSKRAEIVLGDLTTDGGMLNPEQANQFIDYVQDEPTILNQARIVRMNAPQRLIEKMGFQGRILRPADQTDGESTDRFLARTDYAKVKTGKMLLTTKEVIAEVRIPYEVLEDNIERGGFEDHTMRQIAAQVSRDLEELALNGDTSSTDAFLALNDGYMKLMSSNVVNNAAAGVTPDMFDQGLLAMPQKYLRRLNDLKHFVSIANRIKYRAEVAKRATGYGDSALTGNPEIYAGGVLVEASPMLVAATETSWGAGDGMSAESGFLTFPKNLIMGIQREVSVETDKDITAREIIIVVTARIDFKIEDELACVKYINIGA